SSTTKMRFTISLAPCAGDQFGRHQLGRDAFGFLGRVVQLDLDAVRIEEEQLEKRLAIGAALAEGHLLALQVLEHAAQASRAERDVIERAGARLRVLGCAAEIFLLDVARVL